MTGIVVSALNKFITLDDYAVLRKLLLKLMEEHHVKGTLLLAKEAINGTIARDRKGINALLAWLRSDPRFADIETKESYEQGVRILLKKRLKWSEPVAPTFQKTTMVSAGLFRSQDGPKTIPMISISFGNKLRITQKNTPAYLKKPRN